MVSLQIKDNIIKSVKLDDERTIKAEYFIICTGGLSYPQTGSTGDGYEFAKKLVIILLNLSHHLYLLKYKKNGLTELQGLSLKNVEFTIKDNNKVLYREFGEMLFTHYGVSGPIVLSGSSVVNNKKNLTASINLKPALSIEELDKRIQKDFLKYYK